MTLAANQVIIPAQNVVELLHQLRKVVKQLVAAEFKEFTVFPSTARCLVVGRVDFKCPVLYVYVTCSVFNFSRR